MKTCVKCLKDLPSTLEYFRLGRKSLRSDCRKCENLHRKSNYYKDLEHSKNRVREYKKNNPDIVARYNQKRKALKLGNIHEYYTEQQVINKYGTECYICNLDINLLAPRRAGIPGWETGLHIDHVIALSKGGSDTLSNVRPTHGKCNLLKYNKEQNENQMA
jgi:5-methylcytosine-specific restriction endonuclease McrA